MRTTKPLATVLALSLLVAACGDGDAAPADTTAPTELTLVTHDSFLVSDGILEAFTEETGIVVDHVTAGDAGTLVNQAILTKDNPIADVIFGVDNTFLSRAIEEGIFQPHRAAAIDSVSELIRVQDDLATPVDYGDVCLNYDIAALEELGIEPPTTLLDLIDETYRGLLVVQDPATSSPGLAFLLATIAAFPDGGDLDWTDYWRELFANDVSVAPDWSAAYYEQFTRAGGDRPLVVSYASSPPAEVLFGELEEPPTGVMVDGCFRQIEFAGVLKGTEHQDTAGELVDFLLSIEVQEDIPLNMFVYPTNSGATLPEVFAQHTTFPDAPVIMEPGTIARNRDAWIEQWTAIARS